MVIYCACAFTLKSRGQGCDIRGGKESLQRLQRVPAMRCTCRKVCHFLAPGHSYLQPSYIPTIPPTIMQFINNFVAGSALPTQMRIKYVHSEVKNLVSCFQYQRVASNLWQHRSQLPKMADFFLCLTNQLKSSQYHCGCQRRGVQQQLAVQNYRLLHKVFTGCTATFFRTLGTITSKIISHVFHVPTGTSYRLAVYEARQAMIMAISQISMCITML